MTQRVPLILAFSMGIAAVVGIAARPTDSGNGPPKYVLQQVVPKQFGAWAEAKQSIVQVVNPQTQELLDKLYSQVLSRIYTNSEGYRIMLSLAYGSDQRGGLQAHMPETCYPAQGFQLTSKEKGDVSTPYGPIPAWRLQTNLGARREPVTYWFNLGSQAITTGSRFEKRLIEIRFGLTGQVPDGLLFRVSSIDDDPGHAFQMHDAFVRDLLASIAAGERNKLSGLAS